MNNHETNNHIIPAKLRCTTLNHPSKPKVTNAILIIICNININPSNLAIVLTKDPGIANLPTA